MKNELDLHGSRAQRARLGARIGPGFAGLAWMFVALLLLLTVFFAATKGFEPYTYASAAAMQLLIIFGLWYRYDLVIPKTRRHSPPTITEILEPALLAKLHDPVSPRSLWLAATTVVNGRFITNHLLLDIDEIATTLSDSPAAMPAIWETARQLSESVDAKELHAGSVVAALLMDNPTVDTFLAKRNLRRDDIVEVHSWLSRLLAYLAAPKPYFGGIGRDWAVGFTPTLEKFSQNLSADIQVSRAHFHFLAHVGLTDTIVHNLSQGSGGVAIIGPTGSGKTELVHALAERLLEGKDHALKHYQVISLNASLILSSEQASLERLMLTLFGEAVQAGNIILFLDEAQLFFGAGLGAFNMAQILLPVMQSRRLKIVAAFNPNDFQRLKSTNESLASNFSVITVNEPPEADTMKVMEDFALTLESRTKQLVSYEAVREAYRLSGQYMSDRAYPGKGINVLDQAVPYAVNNVMTDVSVQTGIERTLGVRPAAAKAEEADMLLNLEDKIHERMINQVQAVNAIAAALRRVRAGVTNPNRPAGSFLFLGPTGVGKTELARSLAAAYFGDSNSMIRLDMSEYQRPSDVTRLLADGAESAQSLIMSIRKQPFSVVLLDEIEKAHPNILNLLLQMLDEGTLTDASGRPASFKSAIIITTSNAGSQDIIAKISAGESLADFERTLINKLIQQGMFRPELINRYDEVVLFRPLNQIELTQVAKLMIKELGKTLSKQNISLTLTDAAINEIARVGYDPEFGARPMRHIIQRSVEDAVATKILQGQAKPGDTIELDLPDLKIVRQF